MLKKRIIPRLDIKGPNLVKGVRFEGMRAFGPVKKYAKLYYEEGADELFFYDTVASLFERNNLSEFIREATKDIFVPVTVAGGLRSVDDMRILLDCGAEKVGVNTGFIRDIQLARDAAVAFGSQAVMGMLEVKWNGSYWENWVDYGREPTRVNMVSHVTDLIDYGCGEIMVTSIDADGTGKGFDLDLLEFLSMLNVPVIISGGAGCRKHLKNALLFCEAVAVGSLFHYHYSESSDSRYSSDTLKVKGLRMGGQLDVGNVEFLNRNYGGIRSRTHSPCSIRQAKDFLHDSGIPIRRSYGKNF